MAADAAGVLAGALLGLFAEGVEEVAAARLDWASAAVSRTGANKAVPRNVRFML